MPKLHLLVRVAVCFLFVFLPLQSMDEWFYDRFFKLRGRRETPTSFVLVRVNNANLSQSMVRESFHYPKDEIIPGTRTHTLWHQNFYAALLDRIEEDKPALVIFTSYFDEVDDPANASLKYKNVLLSAFLNEEQKLIPPPLQLRTDHNHGFSNIFADRDNIVRSTYLVYSSGSALALKAHQHLTDAPIKRDLLKPMYIDYRGPAGSYPTLDARQLLEELPKRGTFTNKVVFIGREGSRYSDYDTPFGLMSKQEIQANILDTFVGDREIRILPRWVTLVCGAIAVTTSVILILAFPLTLAWIFLILQAVVILIATLIVFSVSKYWAGVANPIFCIFATHLLMLGYKLSRQEEQQWKIQQEAETLKEMDQFKNNFISLFSHDLKTPIAKIKAITNRLLTQYPEMKPAAQEDLNGINKVSDELARYISDILKVTKMETMQLEPTREVIDINRLVEESVQRLKFLADEKNIEIILDLEPLFSMEGDLHLIQEVITNLVENAIKYSSPDKRIAIRTSETENRVQVEVIDEGPGIPEDEIPRVTGKFYRGRSAVQLTKGSGLGLYLSKYFVELHKGQLEIKSTLGKGTTVSFWLPIQA